MSSSRLNKYRVKKIVTRVEEALVEAPSSKDVEKMIVRQALQFGGVSRENSKRIAFEIEKIDVDPEVQRLK